jgi:hypothetical protein
MTPKDIVKEIEAITKTSLEVELSGAKGGAGAEGEVWVDVGEVGDGEGEGVVCG